MYPEDAGNDDIPIFARKVSISMSLPIELVAKIDDIRKDVPRSTYIRRVIEKYFNIHDE